MNWFLEQPAYIQALIATTGTWLITALGAMLVLFFKKVNDKTLKIMLGFASGVMIAASFWSLLSPSIELATELGMISWLVVAVGFCSAAAFLWLVDRFMPDVTDIITDVTSRNGKLSTKRSFMLMLAITLHNIPEGMAIGVAFGVAASGLENASVLSAVSLAIGIGIQNFPEGAAVSMPLRSDGYSVGKSIFYGQLSGIVEPIAGVIGALIVIVARPILPFMLAFAAGAMIYVVVQELIPQAHCNSDSTSSKIATISCMLGFTVMMVLDVALS